MSPLILLSISSPCWFFSVLSFRALLWFSTIAFYLRYWEILYLSSGLECIKRGLYSHICREKNHAYHLFRLEILIQFISVICRLYIIYTLSDSILTYTVELHSWETLWFTKFISCSRGKKGSFLCNFQPQIWRIRYIFCIWKMQTEVFAQWYMMVIWNTL